jgi:hypothetical protein
MRSAPLQPPFRRVWQAHAQVTTKVTNCSDRVSTCGDALLPLSCWDGRYASCLRNARAMIAVRLALLVLLAATPARAQTPAPVDSPVRPSGPPATLVYGNRPIVELRANILARTPAERVAAAESLLDAIVTAGPPGPVIMRVVEGVAVVAVGGRNIFVIVPADVDELAGETLEQKAATAVSRLQVAVDEEVELRTPARLAVSGLQSLAATLVFIALLWAIRRGYRVLAVQLPEGAERRLERISAADSQLVRESRAGEILRRFISVAAVVLAFVLTYGWLTFVLRRFPYTRPWGESLRLRRWGWRSSGRSRI